MNTILGIIFTIWLVATMVDFLERKFWPKEDERPLTYDEQMNEIEQINQINAESNLES